MTKAGRWTLWTLTVVAAVVLGDAVGWDISKGANAPTWLWAFGQTLACGAFLAVGYCFAAIPALIVDAFAQPKRKSEGHDQSRAALEGSIGSPWDAS
jgi:hypothetical protein